MLAMSFTFKTLCDNGIDYIYDNTKIDKFII